MLCNAIGSPLDSKYIDVKPDFLCITAHHVVAASADFVYVGHHDPNPNPNPSPNPNPNPNPNPKQVWHYRTLMSKLTSVDSGGSSLRRKEGRERSFHIDDTPSAMNAEVRLTQP